MQVAATIDHTRLAADTSAADIDRLCAEAIQYGFAAVCVPPIYVSRAALHLQNSQVSLATVIGFPLGYQTTAVKVAETRDALENGANEIDMVACIAAALSGEWERYRADVAAVLAVVREKKGSLLKVIIECCYLNQEQLDNSCEILADLGVDFVKTSTGFGKGGATLADVSRMRAILPANIRIKAAGGIRDREFALQLIAAGADRLGSSSGVTLLKL